MWLYGCSEQVPVFEFFETGSDVDEVSQSAFGVAVGRHSVELVEPGSEVVARTELVRYNTHVVRSFGLCLLTDHFNFFGPLVRHEDVNIFVPAVVQERL